VSGGEDPEEVPETVSVVAGSVIRPAVQRFRLQGLNGEVEGRSFDSSSDRLQVGSHPLNEVEVRDRTVSRFHCEVFVDREGRAWVKDLGSRNGTRVNGVRIREAELQEGMILHVGQLELAFVPLAERNELPIAAVGSFGTLVGSSLPLRGAFAVLEKAAASSVTVLLTGESGTGKSEAAELLHERSGRASKPFRVVDCAAVPANLLESELFGHERGAFTGALERRKGPFELAEGGTLFLDEIGELSLDLQKKLLRVLENREVRRVGGAQTMATNVRVMAASNRDLRDEVNRGSFRSDLYFRLAVLTVGLPALRKRRQDLPDIIDELLGRLKVKGELRQALTAPAVLARLEREPWPGNIRELRNYVERCVAFEAVLPLQPDQVESEAVAGPSTFPAARDAALRSFEREYLVQLMRECDGKLSEAAARAGIGRVYLYKLLVRNGLK